MKRHPLDIPDFLDRKKNPVSEDERRKAWATFNEELRMQKDKQDDDKPRCDTPLSNIPSSGSGANRNTVQPEEVKAASKPKAASKKKRQEAPAAKKVAPTNAKPKSEATMATSKKSKAASAKRSQPFASDAKIKVLAKENPFRKGTAAADRWGKYKDGKTVEQLLKSGVTRTDLRCNVDRGYIRIS
jgi:hypothetical protein